MILQLPYLMAFSFHRSLINMRTTSTTITTAIKTKAVIPIRPAMKELDVDELSSDEPKTERTATSSDQR